MATETQTSVKKFDALYIHIAVCAAFMIGFGYIPPIEPLTVTGMRVIGIFFGMIYGWLTCGLVWPNLMALFLAIIFQLSTLADFLAAGLGADTTAMMIFSIILITAVNEAGVGRFLAAWVLSRPLLKGRPWLFTTVFLLGAFLLTSFSNPYVMILVFWGMLDNVLNLFGIKPFEKYTNIMVGGVVLACTVGMSVFPFKGMAIILLKVYQNISGIAVGYAQWIIFIINMGVIMVLSYVLIAKFVFRPDMSKLKNISPDIIDPKDLVLTKQMKWMMFFLVAFIGIVLLQGFLPASWAITPTLKALGPVGVAVGILTVMLWIKVDGEPLFDFVAIAKHGMMWDMLICCVVVLPMASMLTSEATGLQLFLVKILSPIFGGLSPIVFTFTVVLLAIVLSNFLQNFVVGIMFLPIICSFTAAMGVSSLPGAVLLIFGVHLALLTPAASPFAVMLFSNTKWIKAKDMYKLMGIVLVMLTLICALLGTVLVQVIF